MPYIYTVKLFTSTQRFFLSLSIYIYIYIQRERERERERECYIDTYACQACHNLWSKPPWSFLQFLWSGAQRGQWFSTTSAGSADHVFLDNWWYSRMLEVILCDTPRKICRDYQRLRYAKIIYGSLIAAYLVGNRIGFQPEKIGYSTRQFEDGPHSRPCLKKKSCSQ